MTPSVDTTRSESTRTAAMGGTGEHMNDQEFTTFTLVQPSARRREWQILRGDELKAVLRIPLFSGAHGEGDGWRLQIERHGRVRPAYTVRDMATGAEVARLRRVRHRSLVDIGGQATEWKHLGRKEGFGLVAIDGMPLLRAKVRSGLVRSTGEIQINPSLLERRALVAALLAAYLLIRKNEQNTAGVVAASSVATSA